MIKTKYAFLVLALVAAATYWNGLRAPFVWDDDGAIATNASIQRLAGSLNPPLETPMSARPVANLSLAVNYAMGGLDPAGYHAVNLAVLVASALLLFGVVRRTLARGGFLSASAPVDGVALAASLVWMVHPLLSETVDYTTQRTESMMGLFFLLTLYAAIRARDRKRGGKWTALAVASAVLGTATKESMVVAPLAVLLYDLVFEFDSAAEAWAARKGLYIGLAATWLELGAIIWHWPRSTVGGTAVSPLTYLFNQAQMIARYLWLAVWPHALVLDYGLPRPLGPGDVVPQGLLILALVAATGFALVRRPAAGFLGALFFLALAPTSSVVPILSEVGAERRMYLALAALVVLVVVSAARAVDAAAGSGGLARHRWRIAAGVTAVVVAALAVRTVYRNRDYDSPLTLWQTVVDRRPQGRARFALANELMDLGRHDEAIAELRLAVLDYPDARAGLGTELLTHGKLQEGISVLEAFVAADPKSPNRAPAYLLLGQGHRALAEQALSQRNPALAAAEARKALAMDNGNADAHNLLGAALASQGDIEGAIPEFQAAVRIDPRHESAVNNLARALAYVRSSGTAKTSK